MNPAHTNWRYWLLEYRVLGIILCCYWLASPYINGIFLALVLAAATLQIIFPSKISNGINSLFLAAAILHHPWIYPNHHFFLMFITFALAINKIEQHSTTISKLLGALFLWAALQKTLQPDFMNGHYFGWMFANGEFGTLEIHKMLPNIHLLENQEIMEQATLKDKRLYVPHWVSIWAKPLSIFTVLLEVLIGACWLFPASRKWLQPISILFVYSIPLIRPEWVFCTTLCCAMSIGAQNRFAKGLYLVLGYLLSSFILVYTLALFLNF